jgi:hypothetical protein
MLRNFRIIRHFRLTPGKLGKDRGKRRGGTRSRHIRQPGGLTPWVHAKSRQSRQNAERRAVPLVPNGREKKLLQIGVVQIEPGAHRHLENPKQKPEKLLYMWNYFNDYSITN